MIRLHQVRKSFVVGGTQVAALRGVSLDIQPGEFVAISGPSGSGKSTLMQIIGCLDTPDTGTVEMNGLMLGHVGDDALAAVRNRHIGFIFQSYNLISGLTALKNVELPMVYARVPAAARAYRARLALEAVGLAERADHTPAQLSGGQQQRVAIARALVNNPDLIIADEPTGALDTAASRQVMALFQQLHRNGKTIVLVTHDADVAAFARRSVTLRDGLIVADGRR